jgi:hypothetical protein
MTGDIPAKAVHQTASRSRLIVDLDFPSNDDLVLYLYDVVNLGRI